MSTFAAKLGRYANQLDKIHDDVRRYGQCADTPTVPVVAKGRGGTVTFDGRIVEIRRSRFNAAGGGGTKRIPLRSIAAIQIKEPGWLTNGFVQFTIPGGNEVRARFGRQAFDAAADENSVMFTRRQAPAFLALRDAIEDAIDRLTTH